LLWTKSHGSDGHGLPICLSCPWQRGRCPRTAAEEVASDANLTSGLSMALGTTNLAGESPDNLWESDLGPLCLSPTASPAPQGSAVTPREIIAIDDSALSPVLDSSAMNLMPATPVSQVNLIETPGSSSSSSSSSSSLNSGASVKKFVAVKPHTEPSGQDILTGGSAVQCTLEEHDMDDVDGPPVLRKWNGPREVRLEGDEAENSCGLPPQSRRKWLSSTRRFSTIFPL
jgi:hypothetical protein